MILPPERTASIACISVWCPASPCFGLPPAHSKTTSAPLPPVRSRMAATGRRTRGRSGRDRPRAPRHAARLVAHVDGDEQPAPLSRAICRHSSPMLPCPKIATVSPSRNVGRLDRRDAVAQRLQAGGLAVGDAIVDLARARSPGGRPARRSSRAGRSR